MDVNLQRYVRDLKINRLVDDVFDEEIFISIRDLYFNILDDVDIKMSPGDTRIYFMIEYNYYMEYDILCNTMTCMYSNFWEILVEVGYNKEEISKIFKSIIKKKYHMILSGYNDIDKLIVRTFYPEIK